MNKTEIQPEETMTRTLKQTSDLGFTHTDTLSNMPEHQNLLTEPVCPQKAVG